MNVMDLETHPGKVEIDLEVGDLKLTLWVDVYEDEAATIPARRSVWGTETYYVKPHWALTGKLASQLCGKWRVKLDLESVGPRPEFESKVHEIEFDPCKKGEYSTLFALQPADLQPHEAGTVYLPAVTLSTVDLCGGEGYIWGYYLGPSVMFIQQKPEI